MIKSIKAKEILNSRIEPTVKVELKTEKGVFEASVPSGASTGKYEVKELSSSKAIHNNNKIIASKIIGKDETKQQEIDKLLSKKLGANAILPVSIALCRAGAKAKNLPLWKYISQLLRGRVSTGLPIPCVLAVEGGLHAKNRLDIQEFLMIGEFEEIKKIYNKLGKILGINKVGYEGGFAPEISDSEEILDLIVRASKGYKIKIGLDCAATHLKRDKYNLDFYQEIIKKYPIIFLEDPFAEDDWKSWQEITKKLGKKIFIIGDDLLTTNVKRIKMAKEKKACNGTIIKPNQIGTITETLAAVKLAKSYKWKTMVSHRSGETMDDFIADLAVGVGADFFKSGGPFKPERLIKYNRLQKIKLELKKGA
jgi:enolase